MNIAEPGITPNADTARTTERQRLLLNSHLHELTHEHEDADLNERFLLEVELTDWDSETKLRVHAALDLARKAHEGQERGPYPYSTHFLRVATRILSGNHFAIRDQPNLIIAALLHDTVEDRPSELIQSLLSDSREGYESTTAELKQQRTTIDTLGREDPFGAALKLQLQEQALRSINECFGDEPTSLVASVTNPPSDYLLTKLKRNELYRKHVEILLRDNPFAGIIKISDFIDNAAGLSYNSKEPEKAKLLAGKYFDLVPIFITFVNDSEYFTDDVKTMLVAKLESIPIECIKRDPELANSLEEKSSLEARDEILQLTS